MRQAVVEYKPGEQTRTRLKLVKRGSQVPVHENCPFYPYVTTELQPRQRSQKGSKCIPPAGHFMLPLAA